MFSYPARRQAGLRIGLATLLFTQLYMPAWAAYRLSERSAEEDLAAPAPAEEESIMDDETAEEGAPAPSDAPPAPVVEEPVAPPSEDPFIFNQSQWDRAREERYLEENPPPIVERPKNASTGEPEPGISIDLPYESGLSISGRKLIAFKLAQTRRRSAQRAEQLGVPGSQNDVEMRQELQVRIKGKVGRKITVNVDFDDTKEDKRDISVVYTGDPDEFVQEAAFGDIMLSLPSTEFVSYSKQLFGVRTSLKYKNARLMAIGSRTKGTTETRRFNGATKFERRVIRDTDYVRRTYYNIAFAPGSILPGSELVWRDDRDATNNIQTSTSGTTITETFTVEDPVTNSAQFTGDFDRLKPGDDYIIDYVRGFIQIKRSVDPNHAIAIDYRYTDSTLMSDVVGTPGVRKLLKAPPTLTAGTVPVDVWEYKTFYNLGNIKVVRDNGRGNFILRTVDLNQNDMGVPLTSGALLAYPANITVDFDLGVFNIALGTQVADASLYDPSPVSKFNFLTEYRYRLRDYQVRPNIVFGSERVTVNGRLMRSEIDYFIDYQTGLLQFFNEDELDDTSQIEVTYEYSPFGGQLGQTLVGGRAELDIVPGRVAAGSTFLYTFAPRTDIVPDVRSTPASLMVLEVDGRLTDVQVPFTKLKMTLTGEAAQSRENPNLFGKALVDSMEGVRLEDGTVMDVDFWQLGSNPAGYGDITRPGALRLGEESFKLKDIVSPLVDISENDTLRALRLDYDLTTKPGFLGVPEESSIVQSLSKAGRDFSTKLFLELLVEGAGAIDGTGVDLEVDAGSFNEDADDDTTLDTEDRNNDGSLNEGEDVGYNYDFQSLTFPQGAGNGRVDTEDLDDDGFLRTGDATPRPAIPLFRLSNGVTAQDRNGLSNTVTDLSFSGWRFIRVPLNITPGEVDAFRSIRQVRVTMRGLNRSGLIRLGKVAIVGTNWEAPVLAGGAQMTVAPVNNIDNPEYRTLIGHPAYNDLYGDQADNRTREQALGLQFTLPAGSTATTRSVYGFGRDFSKHKAFNFFYRIPNLQPPGATLFLQLGSDTDFYEWSKELSPTDVNNWVLESIKLLDVNADGLPDLLETDTPGATVSIVGIPSLTRVGQLKIGVRNNTGGSITSQVWVNEVHLAGARQKIGNARRFAADGTWDGWGTFGGVFRSVDRNFQTLTSPVVNQDKDETSAYANITRFAYAPLSANYTKNETLTPAVLRTGESTLVSVLSEGREEVMTARADGQVLVPRMPAFAYSVNKETTDSTDRQERRDRNTYTGSLDYASPWRPDLLPGKKFALRLSPETVFAKYSRTNHFLSFYPERRAQQLAVSSSPVSQQNALFGNARIGEFTDDWSGRLGFVPWDGLTITPNYSQTRVFEERHFGDLDPATADAFGPANAYNKSFSQTQGLAATWRMLRWFEPRLTYSMTGTETNGLPTASSPTAAGVKTLERSSNADLFLNIAPRNIFTKFKPLLSMNIDSSLRLETADTYENIPGGFKEWRQIRLAKVGKITRRDGKTMFGLLSPLDFDEPLARRKQLTARNSSRLSLNWNPLDWVAMPARMSPLRTINLSGTYTNTDEHTDNTLTIRDVNTVSWPDLILSIRDTEKFAGAEKWMMSSQMNLRTNRKKSETFREEFSDINTHGADYRFTLLSKYDCFITFGVTDGFVRDLKTQILKSETTGLNHSYQVGTKWGNWRLTPSVTFRDDLTVDGTGRALADLETQTYSVVGRFDRNYPGGFRLPFTKKILANVNRLTLDTKTSYERRASSLNFERDNTDTYSVEATGEWEISKNFRLSFGGKTSVVDNRAMPEDSLMTIELNSQLVIQF